MKITQNLDVWISEYVEPTLLENEASATNVSYSFTNHDMSRNSYSKVGTATIQIELYDANQIVTNKIEALRSEITQTRADAEVKARGLEKKIQQLLAITNEA